MAALNLQDRLDYLVSYSSQLIFVSGELVRQSQVLDTFINQRTDEVEIALLAASPTTPLARYREQLFKQLISQTKNADFNRPLIQLLAPLNEHDGPIIINVTKAENLPNKLVQELWELVLQSRFANNKQYLNVLLFAQQDWAHKAQQALSTRKGDKPVLLNCSDQLFDLQQVHGSELDKLIARKRQQLSHKQQQRKAVNRSVPAKSAQTKLILIGSALFIAIFGGILSWLYSQQLSESTQAVSAWFSSDTSPTPTPDATLSARVEPSLSEPESRDDAPLANNQAESLPTPVANTELATNLPAELPQQSATESQQYMSEPDPLVTDWQTAIKQVEQQSNQFLHNKLQEQATDEPVEQVPVAEVKLSDTQSNDGTPASQSPIISTAAPAKLTELPMLPADLDLQPGQYLIQYSAMFNQSLLIEFARQYQLEQKIWSYHTQRFGGNWTVMLQAKIYPSIDAARDALKQLPPALQAQQPFIRSAAQILREMRVDANN